MRDSNEVHKKVQAAPKTRDIRSFTVDVSQLQPETVADIERQVAEHRAEYLRQVRELRAVKSDGHVVRDVIITYRGEDGEEHQAPGTLPFLAGG
jgi:hypothetical protein